ncbi:5996_t:CDS:2 [Ambispora gerdemannii]|uniref:5996_t:CDS:1 n=1 Tax=Ambispora gerdemannii TaxID=144530 RepID=A0A9N8V3G6_9GLOM|nr:5996_t:CDS:2 [Ambispora gerdemannii]
MSYQTFDPQAIQSNNNNNTNYAGVPTNVIDDTDYPFGVPVSLGGIKTQMEFLRKVYIILSTQVFVFLAITSLLYYTDNGRDFILRHPWLWYISLVLTFILLVALTYKANDQYQPPPLLVILFTFLHGFLIGGVVTVLKLESVLCALVIILFVFLALIAYTYQSRYSFKSRQTVVYTFVILTIVTALLIPLKFPMSEAMSALVISSILSIFFVLDLYYFLQNMSKNEYWAAVMQLHLDLIVPFRSIHHICEVTADEYE